MINKKANLVFMAILYCFKDEFEREKNKDLFIQEIGQEHEHCLYSNEDSKIETDLYREGFVNKKDKIAVKK